MLIDDCLIYCARIDLRPFWWLYFLLRGKEVGGRKNILALGAKEGESVNIFVYTIRERVCVFVRALCVYGREGQYNSKRD